MLVAPEPWVLLFIQKVKGVVGRIASVFALIIFTLLDNSDGLDFYG